MSATPADRAARPATLTERDLALIHALQRGPRDPWEQLAARLADGSTARAVAARWAALRDARIAWQAAYPGPPWWVTHWLAWVTVSTTPTDVASVVADLAADGQVMSLDLDYGASAVATVVAATPDALGEWLAHGPMRRPADRVDIATHLHTSASRWRIGALPGDDARATDLPETADARPPHDDQVRDILAALAPDPRAPVATLAEILGQPPRTVGRRLGRMLRSGDIRIRVEHPQAAVGLPLGVHWWLRAPHPEALADVLVADRAVRWVASVVPRVGSATTLAAAWLPNPEAVHQMVVRVARACPAAETVRLSMTWQPVKRLGWRVDGAGRCLDLVPLAI
jgi:DNA-binding Lrp family transcriptional regulator